MSDSEDRLSRLEARLARLERLLERNPSLAGSGGAGTTVQDTPLPTGSPQIAQGGAAVAKSAGPKTGGKESSRAKSPSVTNILGWTGATALVLAAVYFIRLAIDSGWLTPERQVALAVVGGLLLIGAGLWLRKSDRDYASLLPAGGLVILFMSAYGAHIYYQLIDANAAAGAVVLICLGALWLGRLFESELYALFAVVGSYSAPFMLHNLRSEITDLVVYFSAWSVLFCIYAIWVGKRRVYLLAAYMALIGFQAIWSQTTSVDWLDAVLFQGVQFAIFVTGVVAYSIRLHSPLDQNGAVLHFPLLLIFYILQYSLLHAHVPSVAPWVALGSAAFLLVGYLVARAFLTESPAGAALVGAYAMLALFHAGYIEILPAQWAPWVALLLLPALVGYFFLREGGATIVWPVKFAVAIVFAINYLRVIANADLAAVPGHDLLALAYALQLYIGYYLTRRNGALSAFSTPLLYIGHVGLMAAAVHILDGRFAVSFAWGVGAIACLMISLYRQDKILGKSSLLIFAASAGKVLLYDLAGAMPLVRIACLLVLGVTLYAGGWLYRKVDTMAA